MFQFQQPLFADYTMTNIQKSSLSKIVGFVPEAEMTENCRLHNKILTDNDFCGQ